MPPKKDPAIDEIKQNQSDVNKKLEEQDKRLKSLEVRINKNELAVKEMERSIQVINGQMTDLKRQHSKSCIILNGKDLPRRTQDEDPTAIFIKQVWRKYAVRITEDELAVVHRTGSGGLIAKFNKFNEGSGYYSLAVRRGKGSMNPNGHINVYANLMLTRYDAKVRFYAAIAKKHGTILFYEQLLSGRIGIVVPDPKEVGKTKKIAVDDFEDLKPFLTAPVLQEVEEKNKQRKQRRSKAKATLNSNQVDELLRSEGEDESRMEEA